jgi:hypothetical protein
MATKNPRKTKIAPKLRTWEGAPAKTITPEAQLRRSVMACMLWEDTFYEEGVDIATRIDQLVQEVPLDVAAQIAIEARDKNYLRHVPLWIVRAMARQGGDAVIGDTLAHVIQRADQLTEFVALYWKDGREPLSAQVKRGLAKAFTRFDGYQLAKYNRDTEVALRDVMFLVHPEPKDDEQGKTWKDLAEGTLAPPDTWEVALSRGRGKKKTWTEMLEAKKLGGMALLRNLRNMEKEGVDRDLIRDAINSHPFKRILPFRFIAAARYAPTLEPEIEKAMLRAASTLPKLPGTTALVVDHSGSMRGALSQHSEMTCFDAAAGLAVLLREICDEAHVIAFSSAYWGHRGEPAVYVPARRGFGLISALDSCMAYGGTNTEAGKALADKYGYDRILIVTDEQSHTRLSDPNGLGYVINVASYKNGIGYGAWMHIDGWSQNVVSFIHELEEAYAA